MTNNSQVLDGRQIQDRNAVICHITRIMDMRISMGYEPCPKIFDELFSKPIDELIQVEYDYFDMLRDYCQTNGIIK